MKFINIDKTDAYTHLKTIQPKDLATVLDKERINEYQIEAACGLTYNYAAMPVDNQDRKSVV